MANTAGADSSIFISRSNDIEPVDGNFTQGCSFSPDGLCILTATAADCKLRLYNTPQIPIPSSTKTTTTTTSHDEFDNLSAPGVSKKNDISNDSHKNTNKRKQQEQDDTMEPRRQPWRAALTFTEGDSIRDYAWYPLMNSYDPNTCVFLSSSKDHPLHLIDAYTGTLRASYRSYSDKDEIESATAITFSPDGNRIVASGFKTNRTMKVFDTSRPGRDYETWALGKTRRSTDGQKGVVSCLSFRKNSNGSGRCLLAVGTRSPASIYAYDDRMGGGSGGGVVEGVAVMGHGRRFLRRKRRFLTDDDNEQRDFMSIGKMEWFQKMCRGGISQLLWSDDGMVLYSGARRGDAVLAWDMRMLSGTESVPMAAMKAYARDGDTNQRLEFDLDEGGSRLFVASRDRTVKIYDVKNGKMIDEIRGFCDAVNGVSVQTMVGGGKGSLVAVAVGARRFEENEEEEGCEGECPANQVQNNKLFVPPGVLEMYHVK